MYKNNNQPILCHANISINLLNITPHSNNPIGNVHIMVIMVYVIYVTNIKGSFWQYTV